MRQLAPNCRHSPVFRVQLQVSLNPLVKRVDALNVQAVESLRIQQAPQYAGAGQAISGLARLWVSPDACLLRVVVHVGAAGWHVQEALYDNIYETLQLPVGHGKGSVSTGY